MSRLFDSLQKLLRVRRYHIDQLRQKAALLNEQIELRFLSIEKNISYINTERLIASVNISGSDSLEAFVKQKTLQNQQYAKENDELKKLVDEIQEQLYEAYVEQKQFEKVQEHEQDRINTEVQRKEIQVIDEMATQINIKNLTKS